MYNSTIIKKSGVNMFKEEKRRVGRPKLADTKLKKKSLIMLACCFVVLIMLILFGAYKLNIIKFNKLGGTVYREYHIGDEICLNNECFEVITDDGEVVTALAKYNLLIGYDCPMNFSNAEDCTPISSDIEGYGYQSSEALGQKNYKAMVKFANSNYWDEIGYGEYVFDERSILYDELQAYQSKLRNYGYPSVTTHMISYYQVKYIKDAGENFSDRTTFWTGSIADDKRMIAICGNTNVCNVENTYPWSLFWGGLRPVIRINKEDFAEQIEVSEDGYYKGKEICLDDECFYVISYTNDTVTALSKYALNITSYEQDYNNPTYSAFSIDNFWSKGQSNEYPINVGIDGTIIYKALLNYEHKLHDNGFTSVSTDILNYNQASELGCKFSEQNSTCENAINSWVYDTTYWLGSASDNEKIYVIVSDGSIVKAEPNSFEGAYIRPVITINKSNISTKEEVDNKDRKFTNGDEYCFEDECFNLISKTDEKIRLLAKYNLLIGKNYTLDSNDNIISEESLEGKEKYGLQSEEARGKVQGSNKLTAVVPFASQTYWWNDSTNQVRAKYLRKMYFGDLEQSYGYVLDEEYTYFAEDLANYKEYLSSIIKDYDVEVELVDYSDFFDIYFGGVLQVVSTTKPLWYEDTGYWTGVADNSNSLLTSVGNSTGQIFNTQNYDNYNGVRVVITLTEKEEEPEPEPEPDEVTTTTTQPTIEKTIVKIIPSGTETIIKPIQKIVNGTNYVDKKITTKVVTTKDSGVSFVKKIGNIKTSNNDDTIFFIAACIILSVLLTTLIVVLHGRKKESSI